ncbi:hypothetical protein B0H17DRAFT_1191759 [Mycena rosella]|uniref:Uncharacterized protein n=1 Tax=Mycena rosella TaxID=1033263 RepID=A0AAD7GYS3_MYCRO|nr:hypothetical protein B0H17DRAFT_1191759 [Mycena rosella]
MRVCVRFIWWRKLDIPRGYPVQHELAAELTEYSQNRHVLATWVDLELWSLREQHPSNSDHPLADRLPVGAIIGIVVALCSMIAAAALFLWLRRRRFRQQRGVHTDFSTPTPFSIPSPANGIFRATTAKSPHIGNATSGSDTRSVSTARRQYLRNELRTTQEKIVDIQDSERRSATPTASQTTPNLLLRVFSNRTPNRLSGSVGDPELIARLREMTARVHELEAQMQSPWAMGLSDEPPPGYSEEEI